MSVPSYTPILLLKYPDLVIHFLQRMSGGSRGSLFRFSMGNAVQPVWHQLYEDSKTQVPTRNISEKDPYALSLLQGLKACVDVYLLISLQSAELLRNEDLLRKYSACIRTQQELIELLVKENLAMRQGLKPDDSSAAPTPATVKGTLSRTSDRRTSFSFSVSSPHRHLP